MYPRNGEWHWWYVVDCFFGAVVWWEIILELFYNEVMKYYVGSVLQWGDENYIGTVSHQVMKNNVGVVLLRGDEKLWWLAPLSFRPLWWSYFAVCYFCFIRCWLVYWQIHLSLHLHPLWHCHVTVPTGLFLLWAAVCIIELLPFTQWFHCREAGWPSYGDGYRLVAAGFMPGLKMDTQIYAVFQLIKI